MHNIYRVKDSKSNLHYLYYSNIDDVPNVYHKSIQDCFEQSYETNDIDVSEDLSYKTYVNNIPVILIFSGEELISFVNFNYLPSIKALDYNIYINKNQSVFNLKNICKEIILIYIYIIKDMYVFEMFYFNVSHKVIFNWAKESLKTGTCIKIRDNYYICYGYINKQYIDNIILKGINILVKNC